MAVLISVATIGVALFAVKDITGRELNLDGAAMLALIGGAAIAIERSIEAVWLVLGSTVGTFWPMNVLNDRLRTVTGSLDGVVSDFYKNASAALDAAQNAGKVTSDFVTNAKEDLQQKKTEVEQQLAKLKELAPSSQRAELLSQTVLSAVNAVDAKFGAVATNIKGPLAIANQSLEAASDFAATFKENPGRRLLSLWMGALAGILAAGFFRLDLFAAVFAEGQEPVELGSLGIVLTGLVIGLGSSPTHEVISVLQEIKKARKRENTSTLEVANS